MGPGRQRLLVHRRTRRRHLDLRLRQPRALRPCRGPASHRRYWSEAVVSDRLRAAADELAAYRARKDAEKPFDLFSTITAVTQAAGTVWTLEVLEAIVETARRKPTLTVEDVSPLCPPTIDM